MAASGIRSGRRLASVGALALLAGLAIAAPAAAAPPAASSPDAEAVVGLRPTFGWTAATTGGLTGYQVWVELASGPVMVASTSSTGLSATSLVALPDDSRLRWFVRAVGGGTSFEDILPGDRRYIRVATSPAAPAITASPPPITNLAAPSFSWSGGRISSRWSILDAAGALVQSGEAASASGQVTPGPLRDGSYQFRVAQRNLVGVEGPPASAGFSVDTAAPGLLTLRRSTARRDARATPAYSWTGLERGAVVTWRVLRASGALVQGPANLSAGGVRPAALRPGSYTLEARQTDLAGNAGPAATDAFSVLPRLAPGVRLPMRNVRRLMPRVGATVRGVRPTLRWTAGPKGTRLYNVQVFRVARGAKLREVLSLFPRRQRIVVPRRSALARGTCYVWRVWPFRGGRATPTPLGVSHFCVRPR